MEFKINSVYPNPFNPETEISYTIPDDGKTELIAYDILGRVAGNLVNEFKSAGSYSIRFNARNLSSGTYIIMLRQHGYTAFQKAILVK